MRRILGCIKRAQEEFNMISEGDIVAVGLSGGKDSMTLLHCLDLYRNFSPVSYELKAVTIDMGFEGFDTDALNRFCRERGIDLILEKTRMGKVIFEDRGEKNPCGLCSRMRRGLLNRICDERGITKLALGHHGDDLIETLFMSMIFESRMNTFKPVTIFERANVVQIRPMIFACEKDIEEAAERASIPFILNPCPASGSTQRAAAKGFTDMLEERTSMPRSHMINAILRSDLIK